MSRILCRFLNVVQEFLFWMVMLGYLFVGSHHDTWSAHGCRSSRRSGTGSNGRSTESRDWQFSSVFICEGSSEYVWRLHTDRPCTSPTTKLIFPPRLCWPPGSTCPIPQCRGTCFCSLEAQIPNFRRGICFVADSQSYLQMDDAGDYSKFYFIFGVLMTEDSYIGE